MVGITDAQTCFTAESCTIVGFLLSIGDARSTWLFRALLRSTVREGMQGARGSMRGLSQPGGAPWSMRGLIILLSINGMASVECQTPPPPSPPSPSPPPLPPPPPLCAVDGAYTVTVDATSYLTATSRTGIVGGGLGFTLSAWVYRAGANRVLDVGICTKTCFYTSDADGDGGGPGSEFPMCACGNDCVDCDGRTASPPPPPQFPGTVCTNNCLDAGGSSCSDAGGPGSEFASCAYGTDCVDCGHAHTVSSPSSSISDWPTDVLPAPRTVAVYAGNAVTKGVGAPPFHAALLPASWDHPLSPDGPAAAVGDHMIFDANVQMRDQRPTDARPRCFPTERGACRARSQARPGRRLLMMDFIAPAQNPSPHDCGYSGSARLQILHTCSMSCVLSICSLGSSAPHSTTERELRTMQTALGHGDPSMRPLQDKTPNAGVSARRKASMCTVSAYLTRAAQRISPKPLAHAAREPDPGLGPACLTVALPSCQRVASAGLSVASADGFEGSSILNPRQLVWLGCLLMASLMAWRRRFAKSPCPRPHRPREKQSLHGALTLLAWCTMLPCTGGVILRGPSVVSDTYIRNLYPNWNLNAASQGWWDGPLTINTATPQVISAVTTDTSALLIKFDLSSFVGATLVPTKPVWLNYFVSDAGDNASLRELVVPWNEVCSPTAKTRALP